MSEKLKTIEALISMYKRDDYIPSIVKAVGEFTPDTAQFENRFYAAMCHGKLSAITDLIRLHHPDHRMTLYQEYEAYHCELDDNNSVTSELNAATDGRNPMYAVILAFLDVMERKELVVIKEQTTEAHLEKIFDMIISDDCDTLEAFLPEVKPFRMNIASHLLITAMKSQSFDMAVEFSKTATETRAITITSPESIFGYFIAEIGGVQSTSKLAYKAVLQCTLKYLIKEERIKNEQV